MWCFSTLLYSSQHRCHHHLINIITTTTPWHQFATFNYFILAFQTRGTSILLRLYCLGYIRLPPQPCFFVFFYWVILKFPAWYTLLYFCSRILHTGSKYKFTSKMSYLVSKMNYTCKKIQLTFDQILPIDSWLLTKSYPQHLTLVPISKQIVDSGFLLLFCILRQLFNFCLSV